MLPLNDDEMKMVASLRDHPGYQLVIDRIQADLDDLTDQLSLEGDKDRSFLLLRVWQVYRKILHILKTTPQLVGEAIERDKEEKDPTSRLRDEVFNMVNDMWDRAEREVKEHNDKLNNKPTKS